MSDYNGLGIVLEEKINQSHLQENQQSMDMINRQPMDIEVLLPPLPNENLDDDDNRSGLGTSNDTTNKRISALITNPSTPVSDYSIESSKDKDTIEVDANMDEDEISSTQHSFFNHNNTSFSTYDINSPSINLENSLVFPSVSNSTNNSTQSTNHSPLKRLKSFKNTIRKLSFNNKSMNNNTNNDGGSSTSTGPTSVPNSDVNHDSYKSSQSNITGNINLITSGSNSINESIRPHINPINSHFKSNSHDSYDSTNLFESKMKCITPTTPPLSSPIITLSENLNICKENVDKIEQNYFETFKLDSSNLKGVENLESYYNYLINEKSTIEDTFNLTKNRLMKSGWCSQDDLNNLALQKKVQLEKINYKLDEVNDKLQHVNDNDN